MNKAELTAAVAAKAGISQKDAKAAVNAFIDTVKETLAAGGNVQVIRSTTE